MLLTTRILLLTLLGLVLPLYVAGEISQYLMVSTTQNGQNGTNNNHHKLLAQTLHVLTHI